MERRILSRSMPAACSTPLTEWAESIAPTSGASALSHATAAATVLIDRSSTSRPCPLRAMWPLRDVSSTADAPRLKTSAAAPKPRPPKPPVIT